MVNVQQNVQRIGVVDYGMGNLFSVVQALKAAVQLTTSPQNYQIEVCESSEQLRNTHKIVIPGQGAMSDCMDSLSASGMHDELLHQIKNKPVFGVCVGLQMLFDTSTETNDGLSTPISGLGVIKGEVIRFQSQKMSEHGQSERLKIPHMGWNQVHIADMNHPLWIDVPQDSFFYFVHSFYAKPAQEGCVAATTEYGIHFCSAVIQGNVIATQFHPEKSAQMGLLLYRNFLQWSN